MEIRPDVRRAACHVEDSVGGAIDERIGAVTALWLEVHRAQPGPFATPVRLKGWRVSDVQVLRPVLSARVRTTRSQRRLGQETRKRCESVRGRCVTHEGAIGEVGNARTARVVEQGGAALLVERGIGGDGGRRWRKVAGALRGMQAFRLWVGIWHPRPDRPPAGVGVV